MKFLALSGSTRRASTNTAMLAGVASAARPLHDMDVFDAIGHFPIFSPDLEEAPLPQILRHFMSSIQHSDGLIISSPEYVRSIAGGMKNAIDWLVSRPEIIGKPIVLMHASHRGDDALNQLRGVLSTISDRFFPDIFLRFELMNKSGEEIHRYLQEAENRQAILRFLERFAIRCGQ
ncbi:NADPH-dependent FMN reductase [Neorhizobium sp. NCHU2750]|uniref:NADPH-dependent FMN reductase n=1 Tax=Neorhizobium sp. NCHU2750 TaxID=1825976 RepID=UPI000E74B17F|nr:FMN reductase [Neorhizobium sp. NCHU2750]